ncbi:MAG: DUF805 domain-containing protein [Gammaproteobacteria bacterium]|jgi:uncharacterized membrane protein YhaH (DUF805 family)|nr:DUF805 domain-containing protein [Gammaproteobacteria bacterium]
MDPIYYFTEAVKKYADFKGRATRKEFWIFSLIYTVIYVLFGVLDALVGTMVIQFIFGLVMSVPCVSVTTRRLHDTGRSGWWQLLFILPLIPVVGLFALVMLGVADVLNLVVFACVAWMGACIVLLVFLAQASQGDNRYGPKPQTE